MTYAFLRVAPVVAAASIALGCAIGPAQKPVGAGVVVNDIHAQLNETRVLGVVTPRSVREIQAIVRRARAEGRAVSIAGGRHAMGGQQFGTDTILIDMSGMNEVLGFDARQGLVVVQAGIQWPKLLEELRKRQAGTSPAWSIRQKQTGADRLSIGGALSANVHGRGLRWKPMIDDVLSFSLVDAEARQRCARPHGQDQPPGRVGSLPPRLPHRHWTRAASPAARG